VLALSAKRAIKQFSVVAFTVSIVIHWMTPNCGFLCHYQRQTCKRLNIQTAAKTDSSYSTLYNRV
jgi:hypothetical protein